MILTTTNGTNAERAFRRLRADIVEGRLAPSAKLDLRSLKETYGMGGSPIREALSRLLTEGLVTAEGQRGFWVAPTSHEDLVDIIEFRRVLECAALRRSIETSDESWEANLLLTFHRLQKQGRKLVQADPEWLQAWEPLHRDFHRALVSGCGSPRMLQQIEKLYDATVRYRQHLMSYQQVAEEAIAEHRMLLDVALERDADTAVELYSRHLDLTIDLEELLPDESADG